MLDPDSATPHAATSTPATTLSAHSPQKARLAVTAAILFALLLGMGLFLPAPRLSPTWGVFFDVMHGPAFALFAALLVLALPKRTAAQSRFIAIGAWVLIVGGGILTEIVQGFIGRSASWHDIAANTLGATAGVLWAATRTSGSQSVRQRATAVSIFLLCVAAANAPIVLADRIIQKMEMPLLASFERPLEMIRWQPFGGQVSRVDEHATHGRFAIRLQPGEEDYCGIAGRSLFFDWSDYNALAFDLTVVANAGSKDSHDHPQVEFILRIQDKAATRTCNRADRYERSFHLGPGTHTITVPLEEVAAAAQGREMDLSRLNCLHFILVNAQQPCVLYIDNLRLTQKKTRPD